MNASRILASVCLALLFETAMTSAPAPQDSTLANFYQSHLDAMLKLRPVNATSLGERRYDHLIDDLSANGRAQWIDQIKRSLDALPHEVDYSQLSRPAQIDYEIFQHELETEIWMTENFSPFEEDPRTYGYYITGSVYMLLAQSTLPMEKNISNSIARMKQIPAVIDIARQTLTHPPKPILDTAILQNKGAIAFYENDLYQLAGETPQRAALEAAAAPIIAALQQYQSFLEEELAARAIDQWRIGREKFIQKLERILDAGMSADEVLSYAESEYERVHRDMYVIARQLWSRYFNSQPLPPDNEEGRQATIAGVINAISKEHGTPDTLLANTRATVDSIKRFISENRILTLPEPDRCRIEEMPEFRRGNSLAYLASAPPLDPQASSYYAISPPPADWSAERVESFLGEYNSHMLQILTIHEAYPGHYVQLEYANRNPSLIRKVNASGVYIEGWAVYTEQMMLDQGYGQGDLRLRMMQLKFYLRAVINAILDHQMHAGSMTDDEAMQLMVEGGFQGEGEARLKIIRSKQSSTQLSTYFVGRMAHYRLRQAIQTEMGDAFQLDRYHEAVLNEGSIPVKYLPERVRSRLNENE